MIQPTLQLLSKNKSGARDKFALDHYFFKSLLFKKAQSRSRLLRHDNLGILHSPFECLHAEFIF
jgi:hypothetical protein